MEKQNKKRSTSAIRESQGIIVTQLVNGKHGTIVIQTPNQISAHMYQRWFGQVGDWCALKFFEVFARNKQ